MRTGRPTSCRCASTLALVLHAAKPNARREAERASHANRDRLAMHEPCSIVGGEALERMAKGMAKIEQRPFALVTLVARDNHRLGLAARRDRMNARGSPREDRAPIGFQPGVESASPIRPYLTISA